MLRVWAKFALGPWDCIRVAILILFFCYDLSSDNVNC
jgi:hypothetical protein